MIKKEWLIWGAILMLAAGLIVALVLVSQPPKDALYSPKTTVATQPDRVPTGPSTPDVTDPPAGEKMTYRAYLELSTEEQIAFRNTFPSGKAFKDWYQQAKKEYEDSQHQVTIGPDGGLDIGDYINP